MHPDDIVRAITSALAFAALYATHMVADHWVQTGDQADRKGTNGWHGRWHCAKHVSTYTLTGAAVLVGAALWLGLPLRPGWVAAGLAVSAVTHYIADRRTPLRRLAELIGKGPFYRVAGGGTNGAYLLDQSWHIGWLLVAALLFAGP